MTPQQRQHHEENREIVARIVQKWRRYKFLSEADQRRLMIALQNMRMSCDSTYLLDHETDYGVKADELATLLGRDARAAGAPRSSSSASGCACTSCCVRRLSGSELGHVLFHGGVPGRERKDLVDRFRDDADCRLFLATDAGGVGLNLQHASVVVNMDLPWNPAVLEQRIGRVHRLGQKQPVRVVNFVAQGTIEEGMLSVLKFKKSLFAGVLDGGEKEVFLGGSRLTKFMETVEKATAAIAEPIADDREEPQAAEAGVATSARARCRRRTRRVDSDCANRADAPRSTRSGRPDVVRCPRRPSHRAPRSRDRTGLSEDSDAQSRGARPCPRRL